MTATTEWEIVVRAEFTLRVKAADESGARDLAQDSLSHVYILDGWKDCVVLCDEWWTVDSIKEYVAKEAV